MKHNHLLNQSKNEESKKLKITRFASLEKILNKENENDCHGDGADGSNGGDGSDGSGGDSGTEDEMTI
eukprot:Pgem_evm1s15449